MIVTTSGNQEYIWTNNEKPLKEVKVPIVSFLKHPDTLSGSVEKKEAIDFIYFPAKFVLNFRKLSDFWR